MEGLNKKNGSGKTSNGNGDKVSMNDIVFENDSQTRDNRYNEYVKNITPKHSWFLNLGKAFLVGGIICVLGQVILNAGISMGLDKKMAAIYCTLGLMLISIILTGFNIYSKIATFAGAGSVVPITGFANSVASPAIEFKREGHVFGIGCKIFTIAGPVILFGIFSSWALGLIYYILLSMGVVS